MSTKQKQKTASLEPMGDFVILKWEQETQTKGGIFLPNISKAKPCTARVLATGPGRLDRHGNMVEMTLKPGDLVVLSPFGHQDIKFEGEELLVVRESEIYARRKN